MKLYELTADFARLQEQIEQCEESEISALQGELDGCSVLLTDKLDGIGRIMRHLEIEADGYDSEIERLSAKSRTLRNRHEWLKNYVGQCLGEGTAIKTPLFAFSWRKSEAVEVDNFDELPEAYRRVKTIVEPDKNEIKKDLKCGAEIPGARLTTRLHLQIK